LGKERFKGFGGTHFPGIGIFLIGVHWPKLGLGFLPKGKD